MALNVSSDAALSLGPQTFYDRVLLERTVPLLLHAKWAQKRNIPAGTGKTIDFRRYSGLAVAKTPLVEGQLFTDLKALAATNIQATISWYANAVGFSDIVSTVMLDPILTETTEILGENAGETLDELIRDVLALGTTVQYAGAATSRVTVTAAMPMTMAEIREAVLTLRLNRARQIGGRFRAIIHPRTFYDIQGTAEWITAQQFAQSGRQFDGSLGDIYGVSFYESDKAQVWENAGAGGTVDVFGTLIFGADAYGVVELAGHNLRTIYKPLGSAGTADPTDSQQTMAWKAAMVAKILNQTNMIRIEHACTTAVNV